MVSLFPKHPIYPDQSTRGLPFPRLDEERAAAEITIRKAIVREVAVAYMNMGQNPSTCPHLDHHQRTVSYLAKFQYISEY